MVKNKLLRLSPRDSRHLAEENIARKIAILESWLRHGVPVEYEQGSVARNSDGCTRHIYSPKSLRSFNTWNSGQYSDETKIKNANVCGISGNGTDTLNKYPALKARAIYLLSAVAKIVKSQEEKDDTNRVRLLELEVQRLTLFIKNQSNQIIEFHRENRKLAKDLSSIERREKGNISELRKNYSDIEAQNIKLREEVSALTKQLKNVYSLKGIKGER